MVMPKQCPGCMFRSHTADMGWHCAYLLITGSSRRSKTTPEQHAKRECGAYCPGRPIRIQTEPSVKQQSAREIIPRKTRFDQGQLLALYRQGMNDAEIGRAVGRSKAMVRDWRYRNGLDSNYRVKKAPEADPLETGRKV